MEKGSNIGLQLEAMNVELRTTIIQFANHIKVDHKKALPASCHTCINFRQIIVLQEYHIGKLTAGISLNSQNSFSE